MNFRDPLHLFLAKFCAPFSSTGANRIKNMAQLRAIPPDVWASFENRSAVQLKYSAEFVMWRFLKAPHREYVVSTVQENNEVLGLRVTRRFKGPVDLLVDYVSTSNVLDGLLYGLFRPTLLMHSGLGISGPEVRRLCWELPLKRQFPFFVTTWGDEREFDMTGITLAASDF